MANALANRHYRVVGLGATGLSCVRFLRARGQRVSVADSRPDPPGLAELRRHWPEVEVHTGDFGAAGLADADILVMSPGVPLSTPAVQAAIEAGVPITSDIELFHQSFTGRLVLITGSNAKSTVTSWLADMAERAGLAHVVGGNLGRPALELLDEAAELAIVELSSFQLELLPPLVSEVATVLNVSKDHLDRYPSFAAYHQAKLRIHRGARRIVFNRADARTRPATTAPTLSFGLDPADEGDFGLIGRDGRQWLARGREAWLAGDEVGLPGRHNRANALAALALGQAIDLPRPAMLDSLRHFAGLAHRCELVARLGGVRYVNDSKGTNVGATLAAIEGLGEEAPGRLLLLAGGQGKGADFSPLAPAVRQYCKAVFLYGEDAAVLAAALDGKVHRLTTLEAALEAANAVAEAGDTVLLSPACASFDQFRDFQHRGEVFRTRVEALS